MNFNSSSQIKLFGYEKEFDDLASLYTQNNFPNKIILNGKKGIGKCTFAYHLINYIFSINEKNSYDLKNKLIKETNYSYKRVLDNIHPNFFLIDLKENKSMIDISQIREMISFSNKTSLNNNIKIVLIDNSEHLNLNSINALLKILEEPNEKLCFILIHDSKKKIFETIKSRCLVYNMNLNYKKKLEIMNSLININYKNNLINYYSTPGEIINLYNFCVNNDIDFMNIEINEILKKINNSKMLKNSPYVKENILNFMEMYIHNNIFESNFDFKNYEIYNFFIKKIKYLNTYNLDIESLIIEFNSKFVNE